jgi:3-methylcrotonyl-CoA carboxylase alpha subunit
LDFPEMPGLRVDTGVEAGDTVTPFYDPMIAKLIAHGPSRAEALDRLAAALDDTVVIGPRSNAGFLSRLCRAPEFGAGAFDTGFIDAHLDALGAAKQDLDRAAAALGAQQLLAAERARIAALTGNEPSAYQSPWDADDGFQLAGARTLHVPIIADSHKLTAQVGYGGAGASLTIDGVAPAGDAKAVAAADGVYVLRQGRQTKVSLRDATLDEGSGGDGGGLVRAPMHGKVLAVLVEPGARVTRGQRLAIIEAMKMEHTLVAPRDGVVAEIAVAPNAQVPEGAKVMLIEAAAEAPHA